MASGEKVARLAAARGARVTVIGLEPDRLRDLAEDLGPAASWREADVRDGTALRSAIDEAAEVMGGIDLVVANAGVVAYGTVRQTDEASFERVLDINLNGAFRTLKYATPHLERSRGHVLVVASALSFMPLAAMASYGASKAAAELLALTYRQEVAHLGVTVGLVHPSWIDRHGPRPGRRGGPPLVPEPAQTAALSGQRHHERRPGGCRDHQRAGASAQPRVRPARSRRGQLGEGGTELTAGLALGKALRGPGGSVPRTGGRGIGEA
ncbi:SDR family NAD(P)-dependent oxidoreductase [Streptomyces sp. GTA36]